MDEGFINPVRTRDWLGSNESLFCVRTPSVSPLKGVHCGLAAQSAPVAKLSIFLTDD